jgi:hypothetical protein
MWQKSSSKPSIKAKEKKAIISIRFTLAAMKGFALGKRAKWKDYVDLYFILKYYHGINEIGETAKKIFGQEFSEKLFREQLAFHKDIDYSEQVEFLVSPIPSEEEIKSFLIDVAINF